VYVDILITLFMKSRPHPLPPGQATGVPSSGGRRGLKRPRKRKRKRTSGRERRRGGRLASKNITRRR
jgi:hypothetical protein